MNINTPDPAPPDPSHDLRQQLTEQIRAHALVVRTHGGYGARIQHLVACGKALSKLKQLMGRGGWGDWVEEQCALSRMTANRYMRLASRADQLKPYMTIRKAYIAAGVIIPRRGEASLGPDLE